MLATSKLSRESKNAESLHFWPSGHRHAITSIYARWGGDETNVEREYICSNFKMNHMSKLKKCDESQEL